MSPLEPGDAGESREPREPAGSLDTVVAGMSCRAVLHRLNDFLDGDLSSEEVAGVTAHLAACDRCEQFGGRVGALIHTLRTSARTTPEIMPPSTAARLHARLQARLTAETR